MCLNETAPPLKEQLYRLSVQAAYYDPTIVPFYC